TRRLRRRGPTHGRRRPSRGIEYRVFAWKACGYVALVKPQASRCTNSSNHNFAKSRGSPHRAGTRELDRESGAAFGAIHGRDGAAMRFGHVVHDGQTEAGSVLLRAVKRFERAALDFVGKTWSAVGDLQLETAGILVRGDHESAAVGHGVDRV